MKRISVRIIQSLSDYPGNMELCQVEEDVIVGVQFLFTTSTGVYAYRLCTSVCCFFEKAVAFCTLIEIISMRIEPSQRTSTLCDYPRVSLHSTSPSAFTFLALQNSTERLFGCNMKEQVQIVEELVVPHEADQWLAVKLTVCQRG